MIEDTTTKRVRGCTPGAVPIDYVPTADQLCFGDYLNIGQDDDCERCVYRVACATEEEEISRENQIDEENERRRTRCEGCL